MNDDAPLSLIVASLAILATAGATSVYLLFRQYSEHIPALDVSCVYTTRLRTSSVTWTAQFRTDMVSPPSQSILLYATPL